jgi:hypothetical protein
MMDDDEPITEDVMNSEQTTSSYESDSTIDAITDEAEITQDDDDRMMTVVQFRSTQREQGRRMKG